MRRRRRREFRAEKGVEIQARERFRRLAVGASGEGFGRYTFDVCGLDEFVEAVFGFVE